ncbi:hypothetical protein EJ04DRAFT_567502 [Polyplosphaeria fusca]|uniref:Uncharacterized protein n=1 Tax=Polyplosphaeria fusca TaxID=682080 RepID=A0A9P4QQC7_9PLEO|nr:hypothetical protein EJ04DRAFT_567502 [Polyplosphaeria fusca]
MKPIASILSLPISLLLLITTTYSTPISTPVSTPNIQQTPPPVACEPLTNYTTSWFLNNTLPSVPTPLTNTTLFYTRGLTRTAIRHAASHSLITLWSIWPCALYNSSNATDNPMRCIHDQNATRTTFYENMSRAFALLASGNATVMHSRGDYEKPPMGGIWGRVELPAIVGGRGVREVRKVREDGSGGDVVWRRESEGEGGGEEQEGEERDELKRREAGDACGRLEDYKFFDSLEW